MYTIGFILLVSTGFLVYLWTTHRGLRRAVAHPPPGPPLLSSYPSVTVIRPIKGLDVGEGENIQAALDTGYPGEVETFFVFDDEFEPALPLVRRMVAEHQAAGRPGQARILIAGPPSPGYTGKMHAMIVGMAAAKGELVAFGDSDTRPDRDVLRVLVELLVKDPRAGSAFAPVVVSPPPQTPGDVGYALLLNAMYGPHVAQVAARDGGNVPFIMGQIMVFRREALAAIGGLESAAGQLVDDMYLGVRLAQAGWRNIQSTHPLAIIQQGMSMPEFVRTYRRWLLFSRSGLPSWSFKGPGYLRGLAFWFGLVGGVCLAYLGWPGLAVLPLLVSASVNASLVDLNHAHGGAPLRGWQLLMPAVVYFMAPAILASMVRHEVNWRGRTYELDGRARLAEGAHGA